MSDIIGCSVKRVPERKVIKAAQTAVSINPANHPAAFVAIQRPTAMKLALVVGKRWHPGGVRLTVGFMDSPVQELRDRILSHMNAWGTRSNVQFSEATTDPMVRIAREPEGYWSYLGTDILEIPADEPTMNLEDFTMTTLDSEFFRVVRHETGHTLGFPHEHMRRALINRLNIKKTTSYFMETQGWSAREVREQVLTPLEAVKLLKTYRVDETSIMCYRIPGTITKTGRPIVGGSDITEIDYKFAATMYPKIVSS